MRGGGPHFIFKCLCCPVYVPYVIAKDKLHELELKAFAKVNTPKSYERRGRRSRLRNICNLSSRQQSPLEHHSKLLDLPAEIRSEIWSYVYEDDTIHIARDGRRLRCAVCPGPKLVQESNEVYQLGQGDETKTLTAIPDIVQCTCYRVGVEDRYGRRLPQHKIRAERESLLVHKNPISGLYRACRQTYNETIDLLYTKSTFALPTQLSLTHFADSLAPARFHQIQHLHLYVHLDRWKSLTQCGWHGSKHDQEAFMHLKRCYESLIKFTNLQTLVVLFRWGGGGWRVNDLPGFIAVRSLINFAKRIPSKPDFRAIFCPIIEDAQNGFVEWSRLLEVLGTSMLDEHDELKWPLARWVPAASGGEDRQPEI